VPTRPLMKPEKPDFFLKTPGILASLASSEYRFSADDWVSAALLAGAFSLTTGSEPKLADWRRGGPMALWSGAAAAAAAAAARVVGGGGAGGVGKCVW